MNRTRSAVAIFSVAATVGCQTAATITRSAPQAMELENPTGSEQRPNGAHPPSPGDLR